MATKTLYNSPTVNLFSFLQEEGQSDAPAQRNNPKKDASSTVLTPAQKAERREQRNAEKAKEAEAAKQKAESERALAALVGPLDDFITQKGKRSERGDKKKSREEFDAQGGKSHHHDGEGRPQRGKDGEKKPYDGPKKAPGEKKQFNRDSGSDQHINEKAPREQKKRDGYQPPRRGREYDKHSAGKTSNKPEDKKGGEGAANWGNPLDQVVETTDGPSGWGDDEAVSAEAAGETKSVHEEEAVVEEAPKEQREEKPAWDDEGFGKMTLKEYQEKVAAETAAALASQVAPIQPRTRDLTGVDLSKFIEKDPHDDPKYAAKGKKENKKPTNQAQVSTRSGEKQVELADFFGRPAGRGGRGRGDRSHGERFHGDGDNKPRGGRGGHRGGDRHTPSHKVPSDKQAFPELSAASK